MNWGAAWPHYQQALDWWAGQRDLDRARDRYLKIIFRAAHPPRADDYYIYTYYGNYIPLDILENALKISTSANDISHINFLLAMTMRYTGGDYTARYRVPDQFEDALKAGKQTDWYDDALFFYAEWMNSYGTIRPLEDGQYPAATGLRESTRALPPFTQRVSERRDSLLRPGAATDQRHHRAFTRNRRLEHLSARFRGPVCT